MDELQELLTNSIKEIVIAVTAAAVLYIRAWIQSKIAVTATTNAESKEPALPGPLKKNLAMAEVQNRLPPGIRPFTKAALDRLVEKAVPEARKRVSERPTPPDPEAN